jgi:hypothetical protein
MPCSFGFLLHPRSEASSQSNGFLGMTVTVRWVPLVPAASGTGGKGVIVQHAMSKAI